MTSIPPFGWPFGEFGGDNNPFLQQAEALDFQRQQQAMLFQQQMAQQHRTGTMKPDHDVEDLVECPRCGNWHIAGEQCQAVTALLESQEARKG